DLAERPEVGLARRLRPDHRNHLSLARSGLPAGRLRPQAGLPGGPVLLVAADLLRAARQLAGRHRIRSGQSTDPGRLTWPTTSSTTSGRPGRPAWMRSGRPARAGCPTPGMGCLATSWRWRD